MPKHLGTYIITAPEIFQEQSPRVGRHTARSCEVSKPRDSGLHFFHRSEIWRSPAEMPVKFQSDAIIVSPNLAVSRLHEIGR